MGYTFNNQYGVADTAQIDAFGRTRTAETTCLLALNHVYSLQDDLQSTIISGVGEVTWLQENGVRLRVQNTGDYVIRQTIASAPYQPGKSQIFEASFSGMTADAGMVKRVGAFDSDFGGSYDAGIDGFFLEANDGVHSFNIYAGGTLIASQSGDNWLNQDYDYYAIDWAQSQLMMVDYQWLGVGRVRFYMVIDGIPRLFYEYTQANNATGVYMLRPNKPIRYEIRAISSGFGVRADLYQICSQISTEGSVNDLSKPATCINNTASVPRSNLQGVLGFRLRPARASKGIKAYIKDFSILRVAGANYVIKILRNPSFSVSPTWTGITNTPIEYSVSKNNVDLTGNIEEIVTYLAGAAFNGTQPVDFNDSAYTAGIDLDGITTEFWICILPISSNGTYVTAMNIEYYD